jgi:hypothetical protein
LFNKRSRNTVEPQTTIASLLQHFNRMQTLVMSLKAHLDTLSSAADNRLTDIDLVVDRMQKDNCQVDTVPEAADANQEDTVQDTAREGADLVDNDPVDVDLGGNDLADIVLDEEDEILVRSVPAESVPDPEEMKRAQPLVRKPVIDS